MAVAPNYGLAKAGIQNPTTDAPAVQQVDTMRGWQSLRCLSDTVDAAALTALNDAPADACELPVEGRNIMIRALTEAAGGMVADVYLFPPDNAGNTSAGSGAGWIEIDGATWTTTNAHQITGVGTATATLEASPYVVIDRKGAKYIAARITTLVGTTHSELVYRVF